MARATKTVAKKAVNRKAKDKVFYVLLQRRFFGDRFVGLYETEALAREAEKRLDNGRSFGNVYVVRAVTLIK